MIDWTFLAVPFLALPLVLLFRFVGCGLGVTGTAAPELIPGYRDYIMGVNDNHGTTPWPNITPNANDVLAYWRLVDVPAVIGATAVTAKDEKGRANGQYRDIGPLPAQPPIAETPVSNAAPGSDAAPGLVIFGERSLIVTDPEVMGVQFQGGYMAANYVDGLYADEMTIECWVKCQWSQTPTGNAHTVLFAGGYYQRPDQYSPGLHGFRIFADADNKWQVIVYPQGGTPQGGGQLSTSTFVSFNTATYVVVTISKDTIGGSGQTAVSLWVNAEFIETALVQPFSRPDGSPFYVGLAFVPTEVDPSSGGSVSTVGQPVMSQVQEVVLYKRKLERPEIENHFALNQLPKEDE
jgi:hypothetical protein